MQAARDQQKSYADLKRKPMEFQAGNKVMLKVSPWKGVVRFVKRGKVNPRVHNTFHVSNLKKCYSDEPLAVPLEGLHVDNKLRFVEEPVEIMDREVKRLKQIRIPIVKVRWNSRRGHEFTWEREDQFQKKYPHLITKPIPSSMRHEGADEELSDGGSPRVIVYRYDGLLMQPVAPLSPDYVPGPEHPPSLDYVPGPEHPPSPIEVPYVPEPEYLEYLAPSDAEAPSEDQSLPIDASPTALSPGYVTDSDPDEDSEEDLEEDHADYPTDGGDDDDDEPSDDDNDDELSDDDDDDTDDEDEEPF
ncbi:hypothetical protein Tco_1088226 [Tanacetum coccineum]